MDEREWFENLAPSFRPRYVNAQSPLPGHHRKMVSIPVPRGAFRAGLRPALGDDEPDEGIGEEEVDER